MKLRPKDPQRELSDQSTDRPVFILGRGIAGIPHFRHKSSKLSDIVRDKSPTLDDVAVLFKIRLIFHTPGSLGSRKINIPEKELSSVVLFITSDI